MPAPPGASSRRTTAAAAAPSAGALVASAASAVTTAASRPLRWIDYAGQHITTDRRAVRELIRRDLDACVVLEQDAQARAAWSEGDA